LILILILKRGGNAYLCGGLSAPGT